MIPGKVPHHPSFKRSFLFALQGFYTTCKQERNIKVMLALGAFGAFVAAFSHFDLFAWTIYCLCVGLVVSAELFNTSIETVIDLVSPEFHPLAGKAKDISAAAVWFLCVCVSVVGAFLFLRAWGLLGCV